jgi:hypothetical protein
MTPSRARTPTIAVGGLSSVRIEAGAARAVEIRTELDAIFDVRRSRAIAEQYLSAQVQGRTRLRRALLERVSPLAMLSTAVRP